MIALPIALGILVYVLYRAFMDSCRIYSNGYEPELLVVDAPEVQESR